MLLTFGSQYISVFVCFQEYRKRSLASNGPNGAFQNFEVLSSTSFSTGLNYMYHIMLCVVVNKIRQPSCHRNGNEMQNEWKSCKWALVSFFVLIILTIIQWF